MTPVIFFVFNLIHFVVNLIGCLIINCVCNLILLSLTTVAAFGAWYFFYLLALADME